MNKVIVQTCIYKEGRRDTVIYYKKGIPHFIVNGNKAMIVEMVDGVIQPVKSHFILDKEENEYWIKDFFHIGELRWYDGCVENLNHFRIQMGSTSYTYPENMRPSTIEEEQELILSQVLSQERSNTLNDLDMLHSRTQELLKSALLLKERLENRDMFEDKSLNPIRQYININKECCISQKQIEEGNSYLECENIIQKHYILYSHGIKHIKNDNKCPVCRTFVIKTEVFVNSL